MYKLHSVTLLGVKLRYRLSSMAIDVDKPTLLFGHSYLWTHEMWREQLDVFQGDYNCIATDLPAHGESGVWQAKDYNVRRLADLHWRLMQHLGIKKFAVIGLSVGGMWGAQLALDHPEAVTAACLMDTFVGAEPVESRQEYFDLLAKIEAEGFYETMLDNLVKYFLTPENVKQRPDLVERFKNPLRQLNDNVERRSHLCELGRHIFNRESLLDRLAELQMPVNVIVGREDLPRPVSESELMVSRLPSSELTVIDHAAHICNLEQPEKVTRVLQEFLQKVECKVRS